MSERMMLASLDQAAKRGGATGLVSRRDGGRGAMVRPAIADQLEAHPVSRIC